MGKKLGLLHLPDNLARHSRSHRIGRDVFRYYAAGANDGIVADSHSFHDDASHANEHIVANHDRFGFCAQPLGVVVVVSNGGARPHHHVLSDFDALAGINAHARKTRVVSYFNQGVVGMRPDDAMAGAAGVEKVVGVESAIIADLDGGVLEARKIDLAVDRHVFAQSDTRHQKFSPAELGVEMVYDRLLKSGCQIKEFCSEIGLL